MFLCVRGKPNISVGVHTSRRLGTSTVEPYNNILWMNDAVISKGWCDVGINMDNEAL